MSDFHFHFYFHFCCYNQKLLLVTVTYEMITYSIRNGYIYSFLHVCLLRLERTISSEACTKSWEYLPLYVSEVTMKEATNPLQIVVSIG